MGSAMSLKFIFAVLLVSIFISGCGGGGGASNAVANLTNTAQLSETAVVTTFDLTTVTEVDLTEQNFVAYVAQAPQAWQDVVGPINNAPRHLRTSLVL